ncbi:MAG TPA: DNA-binding response regulator [Herpetosiphon sp.]|uniref:Transcriptional regulator, LuxR family n=1 Tax=Herpetosiphon aurantiacus (strain ATCC 23779 / DSM 785 / 114-95) TaxID=316274 RepID=A9AZB2_HERA2|nr:LuxR C-terminal-related transcriptional regulator [Herpetosiphon sp.]ABX03658.1 transcriptional regulator, LuxR family [Herpetosiphon aurantiacus DSM 785]HBW51468.1 DNA-binding response regulator [Herpetosiphon sp.]
MHKLSAREYDVLALVDQGWSDAEIAKRLSISIWTVRTHLRSSASKLGVKSRQQAAHAARTLTAFQQAATAKNR